MKNNHYSYLILVLAILAFNCETRFEDDLRVLVKGNLEDEVGTAVTDAKISVYSDRGSCTFCPGEFLLGQNFSQSDGTFEVISLFDKLGDFAINITAGENYTKYAYFASSAEPLPDNLVFDLETVVLKNIGTVNYAITHTSETTTTLTYSFTYKNTDCVAHFIDGELDPNQSHCFETVSFGNVLDENRPDVENSFKTPFGTEVQFTYAINDANPITETFTINQSTYDFSFNY